MILSQIVAPKPLLIEARNVAFEADDGFPLSGTLFSNDAATGPLVLVNSATAVARGYYTKFALACVEAGARAAFIYDYRGVSDSRVPARWIQRINMKDWAILDMPAAIKCLETVAQGHPMVGIGHSIGGTNLGLCGNAGRFCRFAMVASALGTLSLTDEKNLLFWRMNMIAMPIARILGKAPRWIGIGTDLPRTVFADWTRWCRQPNYFFDDPDIASADRFSEVRTPILSVSIGDDRWATQRAIRAHNMRFSAAPIERCHVSPEALGRGPIGHFGFFRSRFSKALWPGVINWMLDR